MSQPPGLPKIWVARDFVRCSGCRNCEIACSLQHEKRIWPESSMVRVFMYFPGLEVPHLCTQCHDYPCVNSCSFKALGVNQKTGAVEIYEDKCTACGVCIRACPGHIPHLHPSRKNKNGVTPIVICDLCVGAGPNGEPDPQCARICTKLGYNCLTLVNRGPDITYDLYAVRPKDVAKNLAVNIYGEKGKEVL